MPRPFAYARFAALFVALAAPAALPGCAQRSTQPPLRSLDRSGRVSLACIGSDVDATGNPGRLMAACDNTVPADIYDFNGGTRDDGSVQNLPHVYALVTQQTRGEVAVIDMSVDSAITQSILDADLYTPGLNFLPVGAQPVDVATSGYGTGAFVAAAEPGRPGIYALPTAELRGPQLAVGQAGARAATLRSWPACSLPAAPGRILVVPSARAAGADPGNDDGRYCAEPNLAHFAPSGDADGDNRYYVAPNGAPAPAPGPDGVVKPPSVNVVYEGDDRPLCKFVGGGVNDFEVWPCRPALAPAGEAAEKLLVTLPDRGEVLVIDAQTVMGRPPGLFDPCPIERVVTLRVDATGLPPPPPPDAGTADACPASPAVSPPTDQCPARPLVDVSYPTPSAWVPRPSAMAVSTEDGRLYIADEGAPVIHVLSLEDGCDLRELPPLLPGSYDEPWRPVYTSALAVSPVTTDQRSYVYAVDRERGGLMAFDVSVGSSNRSPLLRNRLDLKLFGTRDRLSVGGPVRDVAFVELTRNVTDDSGHLLTGACDPDTSRLPEDLLRTTEDFTDGAGPLRLRGLFALVTLTSGVVRVVDVDDIDAACRGARTSPGYHEPPTEGVFTELPPSLTGCESCAIGAYGNTLGASGEYGCGVVERHELRSGFFFANKSATGLHAPAFQSYPVLSFNGSSLRTDNTEDALPNPKLLGPAAPNFYYDPNVPIPPPGQGDWHLYSPVTYDAEGNPTAERNPNYVRYPSLDSLWSFERSGGSILADPFPATTDRNFVVPDFREPRAHVDQAWTLWYEGPIPGFEGHFADSRLGATEPDLPKRGFFDPAATFCDLGTHDKAAALLEGRRLLGPSATAEELAKFANEHADYVQITDELLPPEDPYWATAAREDLPQGERCDYYSCEARFGAANNPSKARNFNIVEAYQDRVYVEDAEPRTLDPDCCFPTLVRYSVRTQKTWTVLGGTVGFLHHTVVDGATGRCVDQGVDKTTGAFCDPQITLRTSRAYEAANPAAEGFVPLGDQDVRWPCRDEFGNVMPDRRPTDGQQPVCFPPSLADRMTFHNGLLHFVLYQGTKESQTDMAFTWSMVGGFAPLQIDLSRGGLVAPFSATFSPSLQRLVVTDGGQNGVFSLNLLTFGFRSYL